MAWNSTHLVRNVTCVCKLLMYSTFYCNEENKQGRTRCGEKNRTGSRDLADLYILFQDWAQTSRVVSDAVLLALLATWIIQYVLSSEQETHEDYVLYVFFTENYKCLAYIFITTLAC